MAIGENLAKIRTGAGLTQRELAERVGVSCGMVAQLERGTKTLSLPLALALAEELECSVLDFISIGNLRPPGMKA